MNVLLVNGSPHPKGCTYTALSEVSRTLEQEGIGSRIFWIGNRPISGCIACGACGKKGRCAIDDKATELVDVAGAHDGFVFGSPVHYAGMAGNLGALMDRAFFSDLCAGRDAFYLKPAAAVVSARRAGTTAALDQMNKYFLHAQMPVIPSRYWNMVHGNTPEEVLQDLEGLQILRVLARNMAWFLKCKQAGQALDVSMPQREKRVSTNFIR